MEDEELSLNRGRDAEVSEVSISRGTSCWAVGTARFESAVRDDDEAPGTGRASSVFDVVPDGLWLGRAVWER
jgi:hypothetical protein